MYHLRKIFPILVSQSIHKNNILHSVLSTTSKQQIPATVSLLLSLRRNYAGAYEGDGKTKVQILNRELDYGLMIDTFSQFGFRLNNDMVVMGPMAIFPRSVLSWNISNFNDIDDDSLSLFYTLEPKLDILVLGIGDQNVTPEFSRKIIEFMRKYRINVEILGTQQACATFNFLNAENRMVAAGLIPPIQIEMNENDILQSKLRKKDLYKVDD